MHWQINFLNLITFINSTAVQAQNGELDGILCNGSHEALRTKLLEKKRENLSKEVGQLHHPNLPLKRNWSPPHSSNVPKDDDNANERVKKGGSPFNRKMNSTADSSSLEVQKCIGRFFYETGINFSAAEAPSFKKMVDAIRISCVDECCDERHIKSESWGLLGSILLCIGGLAIVCAMIVTTCLMSLVITLCWEKSLFLSACFLVLFGSIEVIYLSGCFLNFHLGAWYLLVLLIVFMSIMLTWHYGTVKKYEFDLENKVSLDWLTDLSSGLGVSRVNGIGFVYTDIVTGIPAFFSHFITNLPAFHQVLIFVTFKSLPIPHIPPNQRFLVGRVGPKEYRIYRCIMRYGYRDRVSDADDFEEQIIRFIGEFISQEETDSESLMVVTTQNENGTALVPLDENETARHEIAIVGDSSMTVGASIRRKKVRFLLPPSSPRMMVSVREELQELVDARESGTAYFMGQCHLSARPETNFLKKIILAAYVFLDRNSRDPPVALNIPHAALLEVGMVYKI